MRNLSRSPARTTRRRTLHMPAARPCPARPGRTRLRAALLGLTIGLVAACSAGATPSPSGPAGAASIPAASPATNGSASPAATVRGCAASGESLAPGSKATLILDYLPNAVHAPIYEALGKGYYRSRGIDLAVQAPTSTSDTLKLMAAGKADFGIVSLLDFISAWHQGQPIRIVGAVEQTPLAAVMTFTKSGITSPRQLEGRLVGVTGVPSDLAALDSMVKFDGGDPTKVRTVTVGFNAVQSLASGAVDAAIGFWSAEGLQLATIGPTTVFRLDRFGAPSYPELVMFARNDTIAAKPCLVQAFMDATAQGYTDVAADPDGAVTTLLGQTQGLTLNDTKTSLVALLPVFRGTAARYGAVDLAVLARYTDWARAAGIIDFTASPGDYATDAFSKGG